jgi:UDP-glucose 4-epimerase
MARVLVTGGAGYVGSAAIALLEDQGHETWTLDDLSTGHKELILSRGFTRAKVGDRDALTKLFRDQSFDCVMHFAAKSIVAESVAHPDLYFENNVNQTEVLLEACASAGIKKFVFSSSCAIFGNVKTQSISESDEKNPTHPYGESKLRVERFLESFCKKNAMLSVSLRYFNAAGAEPKLRVGEIHHPETHLIPTLLRQLRNKKPITIFGDRFSTPDGTCIRDYIHVTDIASAHIAAMNRIHENKNNCQPFEAFNLGSGQGYSVKEVIDHCQKVLGLKTEIQIASARPGDPPRLVANASYAKQNLGFKINYGLSEIIESAWAWEKKRFS